MDWYYAEGTQQKGPVQDADLDQLVSAGVIRDDTLVWHPGMTGWQTHASVRGARVATMPEPAPAGEMRYCGECGRPFPASELVSIGGVSVCATCKPTYMQRLREGNTQGIVGARRYAGFWIRFVARVIDGVLLFIVSLIIRIPFGIAMFTPGFGSDPRRLAAAMGGMALGSLLSLLVAVAYEAYFLSTRGATLGKMALGLKVIRADGGPISPGLAVGRYFAMWISYITLMIGFIIAGFDDQKRSLHDRICETRVIHVN